MINIHTYINVRLRFVKSKVLPWNVRARWFAVPCRLINSSNNKLYIAFCRLLTRDVRLPFDCSARLRGDSCGCCINAPRTMHWCHPLRMSTGWSLTYRVHHLWRHTATIIQTYVTSRAILTSCNTPWCSLATLRCSERVGDTTASNRLPMRHVFCHRT